jgi:hypothetical protein
MKAILTLGMALAAGIDAYSAECVVVELGNPTAVPPQVLLRAKDVAASIFAGIGVELRWSVKGHRKAAGCSMRVEVELETSDGPEDRPGVLAYASVGIEADKRIHVFVDRVNAMVPALDRAALLGHVLAHEITHILEGVARHSDAGVMKAHWEARELRELGRRPLRFQLVDQALIHAGLIHAGLAAIE